VSLGNADTSEPEMSEFMLRFWYDVEVNESFRKRYFSRLNRFRNEGRNSVMKKDWNNVSVILKYQ
jgi:hypothetical protein